MTDTLIKELKTLGGHTPGPWTAIKGVTPDDEMRCAIQAERADHAYLVATIENGAPGDICDTEFINAKLMAKAPEMLALIQSLQAERINARWLLAKLLPKNLQLDNPNIPDDAIIPIDVEMGYFRRVYLTLSTKGEGA